MLEKQAIIFDLDNTLLWDERSIEFAFQATCNHAAAQAAVDARSLERAVRESANLLFKSMDIYEWASMIDVTDLEALWGRFHLGEHLSFRKLQELAPAYRKEAWNRGLRMLGIDRPDLGAELAEQFMEERRNHPLVYDDTFEVLNKLREQYALLLLTNGAPDLQQEKIDSIPGLANYFDHIVISGTFGAGKPAPSIFFHALELLRIVPGQAVMVGDTLGTDIKGANAAGITSIWINRHGVPAPTDIRPPYEVSNLSDILPILNAIRQPRQQIG